MPGERHANEASTSAAQDADNRETEMVAHPEIRGPLNSEDLFRKWIPDLCRVLLERGPIRFGQIDDHLRGISSKTLSRKLDVLRDAGVAKRTSHYEIPPRVDYRLTSLGQQFARRLLELQDSLQNPLYDVPRMDPGGRTAPGKAGPNGSGNHRRVSPES